MSRLPIPGSDDNVWGTILNDFLSQSLASDGTISANVVGTSQIASGAVTTTQIADGTITTTDISATAGITRTQLSSDVQTTLTKADNASTSYVDLTSAQTISGIKTFSGTPVFSAGATMNATSIATDTTTGLKIGTATTQKLGFFGVTAVVQQAATTDLGTVLSNLGLRASGTAYPLTTSGAVALSGTFAATSNVRFASLSATANITLTTSNIPFVIASSTSAFTITLPSTTTAGYWYTIKNINTGIVTVSGTIDGTSTYLLNQWDEVTVFSTTTSGTWYTVGNQMRTLSVARGGTGTNTSTGTGSTVLSSSPSLVSPSFSTIVNTGTLTLPTTTDTLVGRATTDTLTNKTISGASNTISNIPESAVVNLTTDLASKMTSTGASNITVGTTAPSSPAVGDLWVDTN